MTPPQQGSHGQGRPRAASPAERSVEFAATQDRLKKEAAERRVAAEKRGKAPVARRPTGRRG